MPQMMPINWILSFIFFIIIFYFFNILNYYNYNIKTSHSSISYLSTKKFNWKW